MSLSLQAAQQAQQTLTLSLLCFATDLHRVTGRAVVGLPPRITKMRATRQHQGAKCRYRTACKRLVEACAKVRHAVNRQYRGETWAPLRRAFGTNHPCIATRPIALCELADRIALASRLNPGALRRCGIRQSEERRLARLAALVRSLPAEISRRGDVARAVRATHGK